MPSSQPPSSPSTGRSPSPSSTARTPGLDALETVLLDSYHLFHATRAELLARLHRVEEAKAAYDRAIELTTNDTERRFLTVRRRRGRRC